MTGSHNIRTIPRGLVLQALVLIAAVFFFNPSQAQYFSLGQEPASEKWQQIKTDNFRLIYPLSLSGKAQYISNALEYSYRPMSFTMGSYPPRMPVILHPNTTYSNAYVPYAPKRIELNTTTPQDNLSQDWIDQLILHELRHSVQYNQVRQGFTKVLSYIFGEQVVPLMYGVFTPFWFIEGDAVITETALSPSGRGRDPKFEMRLKAQFLDRGIYNYDKATHGSYKDFTPDIYELGYHLMSKTQQDYGRFIWSSVIARVGRKPFTLVPFSHGIYKETGLGKVKLYRKLTVDLRSDWNQKDEQIKLTGHRMIKAYKRAYTDYENPVFISNTEVVMLRTAIDDIPKFVSFDITTGEEKRIFTPGVRLFTEALSGNGETLCWSERHRDARWSQRDYAVVRAYDLRSGKAKIISRRSKLFAPSISPDGKYIAAVEATPESNHSLIIIDTDTDSIVNKLQFPGNEMILTPAWNEESTSIVLITIGDKGKAIVVVDFPGMEYRFLTEPEFVELYHPAFYGNYVLYSGAYNGKADIYGVDTETGNIFQMTSVRFGAYRPAVSPDGTKLVFANYTANGYRLAVMDIDKVLGTAVNRGREYSLNLYREFEGEQDFVFYTEDVPEKTHQSKKYKKGWNLFNIHSWGPLSIDASNEDVKPGIQVQSQNLLSTSFTSLGWEYDLNEEAGRYYFNYSYQGLYPALDLTVDYTTRKRNYSDEDGNVYEIKWFETGIKPRVRIPFDLTRGKWFRSLQPSVGITYSNLKMAKGMPVEFRFENIFSTDYSVFFSQTTRNSSRDLFPRWGQVFQVNFRHTPVRGENFGEGRIFAAEGIVYIPGIMRHHGIRFYGGYQTESGEVIYSDIVSLPRGLSGIIYKDFFSGKIDYVFPIFYPDWRVGPIAYFKRLKARLFYDFYVTRKLVSDSESTFGADLTTDVHLFSLLAPFDIGVRYIYFPSTSSWQFNFLFSFNIGSIY